MEEFKNVEIRCRRDDSFSHMRNVNYSCGCRFVINEEDVYSVCSIDYFGEEEYEYYAICPICGYINKLDDRFLPDYVKLAAINRSKAEPFLYRKSNLISELIYLGGVSPQPTPILKRIK